jgi:hypothetical protein
VVEFRHILCPSDLSESSTRPPPVLHVVEWLAEEEPRAHAHFNVPELGPPAND